MSAEEAVKEIERTIEQVSVYLPHDDDWIVSLKLAVAALQAKQTKLNRSRWEGREYCANHKGNIELCPMLSHDESDCERGMYIHRGCLVSNSGEFQYVKIDFCPICGRPLTDAAWADLERKINGGKTDS